VDVQLLGFTSGHVVIKWFFLGLVTVCGQINHLSIYNKVTLAFHLFAVGKSTLCLKKASPTFSTLNLKTNYQILTIFGTVFPTQLAIK